MTDIICADAFRYLPTLTHEEEHQLLIEYKQNGSIVARNKIILSHLRYVAKIAKQFSLYCTDSIADLFQHGVIGLIRAIKNIDLEKYVSFASYAIYWVKEEIREFILRNASIVKSFTRKIERGLFFNSSKLNDVDDNELQSFLLKKNSRNCVSIYDSETLSEIESVYNINNINDDVENEYSNTCLKKALSNLTEREFEIIKDRYLCETPLARRDIAEKLGVSQQRVDQIEKGALLKLRGDPNLIELMER